MRYLMNGDRISLSLSWRTVMGVMHKYLRLVFGKDIRKLSLGEKITIPTKKSDINQA